MKRIVLLCVVGVLMMSAVSVALAQGSVTPPLPPKPIKPMPGLEIFRITSAYLGGITEPVAPPQEFARFPVSGLTNVLLSAQDFSEKTKVFFASRPPNPTDSVNSTTAKVEITDKCKLEQTKVGMSWITSVSFMAGELPAKKGWLIVEINPMPAPASVTNPVPPLTKKADIIGILVALPPKPPL